MTVERVNRHRAVTVARREQRDKAMRIRQSRQSRNAGTTPRKDSQPFHTRILEIRSHTVDYGFEHRLGEVRKYWLRA